MTWKEFSDLSKSVFVQAASEEFGIKGRRTNASRVSILTGISRKEVKRQRDLMEDQKPAVQEKTTDATKVLSGWFQDSDYLDENSQPGLLQENGPKPSFESLCTKYSGDIAMPTMLKELLNTNTIERTDDGLLRAKRRYYQPAMHDDESLIWAASLIKDLAETSNHDVFRENQHEPRFLGKSDNMRIHPESVAEFRAFMETHGQNFLEQIDDWLTEHEAIDSTDQSASVRLGVGLFAIEETKE